MSKGQTQSWQGTNRAAMVLLSLAGFLVIWAAGGGSDVRGQDKAAAGAVDFATQVKPILKAQCYRCHGSEKQKHNLRLDVRDAALAGGDSGRAIIPGDVAASKLIHSVEATDAKVRMPKNGKALKAEEIEILRRWVAQGAPWPAGVDEEQPVRNADWWSLKPVAQVAVPNMAGTAGQGGNAIDAFIGARLAAAGLKPAPRADKATLLRRLSHDLHGLGAESEEMERFLADDSVDGYEKLVERMLASPRFGERVSQMWLDLVRYAETEGFKSDETRPLAYQYRNYVIQAFNQNLPYDRFIRQQIAGDELEPGNVMAATATGFLCLFPDEDNAANLEQRRQEILDDIMDVTGQAVMGLTVSCARCHDHKFDAIRQEDYYRLQSMVAGVWFHERRAVADQTRRLEWEKKMKAWEDATASIRQEMGTLIADTRAATRKGTLSKFRKEIQDAANTDEASRTPYQQLIAQMAMRQVSRAQQGDPGKLKGKEKERYEALAKELATFDKLKPVGLEVVMGASDVGPTAPAMHRLAGGNWHNPQEEVRPGFPRHVGPAMEPDMSVSEGVGRTTGRRAALARWITDPRNPLTGRVMVNRMWQMLFGRGIVGTPNDLGSQGELPTHPELLDWLTRRFIESGWDVKELVRLMVMSEAYRRASVAEDAIAEAGLKADPQNHLLWKAHRKRLSGETIRDMMLQMSGDLNLRLLGPSARPELPKNISPRYAWKPDEKAEDRNRRSIYVFARRNMRHPLFDAFDQPDMNQSCGLRARTTTAIQSLELLNSEQSLAAARRWAGRLIDESGSGEQEVVERAMRQAYGTNPEKELSEAGVRFIRTQAELIKTSGRKPAKLALAELGVQGREGWESYKSAALVDFCQAIMNSNGFLYVD